MVIEELGPGVANAWNHLRPATRTLLEKAWQSSAAGTLQQMQRPAQFDPRADQDTRVVEVRVKLEKSDEVAHLTHLEVSTRIEVDSSPPGATSAAR